MQYSIFTFINVLFRSTFVFLSTVVILIIILYSNELQEININELCLINYVVVSVKQNLSLIIMMPVNFHCIPNSKPYSTELSF